jgi:hypothetical protein
VNDFEPDEFLVAHALMKAGRSHAETSNGRQRRLHWELDPEDADKSILRLKLVCLPPNHRLTTLTVKDLSLSEIYSLIF